MLTAVVGASIVASLIGRGQIADLVTKPEGPADRMRALRKRQMETLEEEDSAAVKVGVNEDDEENEEDDDEEGDE